MDNKELRRILTDGVDSVLEVLEYNTEKNKLVNELTEIIKSEEFNISKEKLTELQKELTAKTNFCFVLINELKKANMEHNDRATSLYEITEYAKHLEKELRTFDLLANKITTDLEKLCGNTDFVESKKVMEIINQEVPEEILLPVKTETSFE
jgi:CRISPR/Cas system-associated exonuclease Cas4 (RecB family)